MRQKLRESVLVTGGAGFIGSHLSEHLLREGYKVVCLDNFNDFYSVGLKEDNAASVAETATGLGDSSSYEVVCGDIRDKALLEKLFAANAFKAVIHLAACAGVRPSIRDPELYYDVNVIGTLRILEAMRKHEVHSLVFASSSSLYGNNEKVPFSETDPVDHPISPYAATKKSGELLCHTYHHLYAMNIACLRFFTVYGPRQRPDLAIRKFSELMRAGAPVPVFGDGLTERDYTYVDDLVDGIGKALQWSLKGSGKYEVFNLGESRTISLNQMIASLERHLGIKAEILHLPEQPGDVKRTYADIGKARAMLGYAPEKDFDKGLGDFVNWLVREDLKPR